MDILDDSTDTSNEPSLPLGELVDLKPATSTGIPQGAVRNRAATSAILSGDPSAMTSKYQMMMSEAADGQDTTHQQVIDALATQNKTKSMKHVINILGDRSIPLDQKKSLMNFVQTNQFKEDPSVTLQTNALIADNKGESLRGEAARISTSDAMGEMQKEREDRQKLVNGFMASLPAADASMVGQVAEAEVMPFGRNVISANISKSVGDKTGAPTGLMGWVKDFLLPGSSDADLQKKLMSIPPESRGAYTASLLSSIKDSATVFHKENYFAQYEAAVNILEAPTHSNTGIWAKNMGTILDALWVGSEVRSLSAGAKLAGMGDAASRARRPGSSNPGVSDAEYVQKADWELVGDPYNPNQIPSGTKRLPYQADMNDISQRIKINSPVRQENPVSPYSVIEQVNPSSAREINKTIVAGTDDLSMAVTGVSREQALANSAYPQISTESGTVLNKVNQDVQDVLNNTGATRYTPEEFQGIVTGVQHDFREATGLAINDAMTTFRVDGDHIAIDAHYTTPGGAFTTAEGAREQAKYALRQYGIRDDEVVVMKRQGMDYVPVQAGDTQTGDYIVKVKTLHAVDDSEVTSWNPLDVKRNWSDRISQTGSEDHGSLSGHLLDPGSMLHPTLTGSASIASDQAITFENVLLKPIRALRDEIGSFPKARQKAIEEYMVEANTKGLKHDPFDLTARGFSKPEIKSLKDWKDVWDGHYYLENYDMVRTLNSQGYSILSNQTTKLFAKPVTKNQNIGKVFDPASQNVRVLSQTEMDALYNLGGSYAQLRRPITIGSDTIEHMIVRNTPSEYLRKVRDTDAILNYREGYYTVNYKAPKFVDEISIDSAGKEVRRTVAVAGNTKDADMFIQSQQLATGNKHVMREDSRGFKKDGDGYWDLNEASGRIAQRVRGKPLTDAVGINSLGVGAHIENPMESAVRAAKSLAGRSVNRPMLETAKKRFVSQYGELLEPNQFGMREYPSNRSQIVDRGSHTSSLIADARTTYGYIKFLEDGYINTADQMFKGGMNILADELGKLHLSTPERVVRTVGDIAPSHFAKSTVFQAYIALSNPIRQWIVQSHQVGRTMAYNPVGWANGGVLTRMTGYLGVKSTLVQGNQVVNDFVKFVDDSGMIAGVDRNSLVRGMGLSMADSSSGFKRAVGEVGSFPQTIGFDVGEKVNQLGHLAAIHEAYTRKGVNLLDKTQRDIALTEARALSYDLNKAGELHYTQGSFASILQFLQMPHKAVLQVTNRKIAWDAKARMIGWDILMFGVPTGVIAGLVTAAGGDGGNILPDDPDLRDKLVNGIEAYQLNKMFTMLDDSGEKTRIDFSALRPYELDGWARMYTAMSEKGMLGMVAASPAGQVLAVDGTNNSRKNGRIPQAMITMGKFFNESYHGDSPEDPTTFGAVLSDVAKISSGWTATSKAMLMLETRKTYDSLGIEVDSAVTTPEILAAFLGFGTMSSKELYQVSQELSGSKKKHEEEVMMKYRDILNYTKTALEEDNPNIEHIQKVSGMLLRTFPDPYDMELVNRQWQKDLIGKEASLFISLAKASGMPSTKGLEDTIRIAPLPQQEKDQIMGRLKDMKDQRSYSLDKKE